YLPRPDDGAQADAERPVQLQRRPLLDHLVLLRGLTIGSAAGRGVRGRRFRAQRRDQVLVGEQPPGPLGAAAVSFGQPPSRCRDVVGVRGPADRRVGVAPVGGPCSASRSRTAAGSRYRRRAADESTQTTPAATRASSGSTAASPKTARTASRFQPPRNT